MLTAKDPTQTSLVLAEMMIDNDVITASMVLWFITGVSKYLWCEGLMVQQQHMLRNHTGLWELGNVFAPYLQENTIHPL